MHFWPNIPCTVLYIFPQKNLAGSLLWTVFVRLWLLVIWGFEEGENWIHWWYIFVNILNSNKTIKEKILVIFFPKGLEIWGEDWTPANLFCRRPPLNWRHQTIWSGTSWAFQRRTGRVPFLLVTALGNTFCQPRKESDWGCFCKHCSSGHKTFPDRISQGSSIVDRRDEFSPNWLLQYR